jgi:hypothetical protein
MLPSQQTMNIALNRKRAKEKSARDFGCQFPKGRFLGDIFINHEINSLYKSQSILSRMENKDQNEEINGRAFNSPQPNPAGASLFHVKIPFVSPSPVKT